MSEHKSRAEWLQEALLLEQLGGEWEVGHAAAFCGLSDDSIYRSQCPRIRKAGEREVKGRGRLRFLPADVRTWNAKRSKAA